MNLAELEAALAALTTYVGLLIAAATAPPTPAPVVASTMDYTTQVQAVQVLTSQVVDALKQGVV